MPGFSRLACSTRSRRSSSDSARSSPDARRASNSPMTYAAAWRALSAAWPPRAANLSFGTRTRLRLRSPSRSSPPRSAPRRAQVRVRDSESGTAPAPATRRGSKETGAGKTRGRRRWSVVEQCHQNSTRPSGRSPERNLNTAGRPNDHRIHRAGPPGTSRREDQAGGGRPGPVPRLPRPSYSTTATTSPSFCEGTTPGGCSRTRATRTCGSRATSTSRIRTTGPVGRRCRPPRRRSGSRIARGSWFSACETAATGMRCIPSSRACSGSPAHRACPRKALDHRPTSADSRPGPDSRRRPAPRPPGRARTGTPTGTGPIAGTDDDAATAGTGWARLAHVPDLTWTTAQGGPQTADAKADGEAGQGPRARRQRESGTGDARQERRPRLYTYPPAQRRPAPTSTAATGQIIKERHRRAALSGRREALRRRRRDEPRTDGSAREGGPRRRCRSPARGRTVMATSKRADSVGTRTSAARYELRVRRRGAGNSEYAVWQLPAAATPHVTAPVRIAGLAGRNLDLVEHSVLKRLARAGVKPGPVRLPRDRHLRPRRRRRPDPGPAVPRPRPDARPRQHTDRGRGNRRHGARRGRLLARHDHVPPAPPARADGVADAADVPAPAGAGIERHETPKPRRRRRPTAGRPGTDPRWSNRSTGRTCARSAA